MPHCTYDFKALSYVNYIGDLDPLINLGKGVFITIDNTIDLN